MIDEYTMIYLKKLALAPLFLIVFSLSLLKLNPLLGSYEQLFSLSIQSLLDLALLSGLILLASFLFILTSTFTQDWKLTLPISALAAVICLVTIPLPLASVLAVGTLVVTTITHFSLQNSLKSYLNFSPGTILGPSIRSLTGLMIIVLAIAYFLSINNLVRTNGFQIPDTLIDPILNLSQTAAGETQSEPAPQLSISPEQLELLRQNPQLLRQSGLDPKILDSLNQPQKGKSTNQSQDLVRSALKTQIDNFLKPYLEFVPVALALLFFFTLQAATIFFSILIYPLLWLIFFILEKIGFVRFEVENRPVKKLVI